MRRISLYARRHYIQARVFITLAHILLFAAALHTGTTLDRLRIILPGSLLFTGVFLVLLSVPIYMMRNRSYYRSRISMLLMLSGVFMIQVFSFNNNRVVSLPLITTSFSASPTSIEKIKPGGELKKQFIKFFKSFKKLTRTKKDTTAAILIVLVLLGAAGLILLTMGLSCSLSCNGYGLLAFVALFGGIFITIFLSSWAIRKIRKKNRQVPENREPVI
jgi:hypothetical protein